jgi:hypothetical protein
LNRGPQRFGGLLIDGKIPYYLYLNKNVMIRKINVKDYLLMSGHDLSWSCRQLIGLPSHTANPEQIPYFVLEDDIDNAISSIYTQKDNVIESKDRVYFTKTSTIPRYKLKEYLSNNKIIIITILFI